MKNRVSFHAALLAALLLFPVGAAAANKSKSKDKEKKQTPSALDAYISEAMSRAKPGANNATPGSLYSPYARFADMASDFRATRVDDMVTVVVAERASAVASGTTKTQRNSNVQASVSALAGVTRATGPWANLANASKQSSLDGQGATTRDTTLTTTLSARVTQVLPNGYLVIAGVKKVNVNSEDQTISLRGIVRPADLSTGNTVLSDQVADMEVKVDGKGIVNDAVKKPFILYRILLGLLPF